MTGAMLLLAAVTLARLAELWLAGRNTRALLARGAREVAPGHYPAIVLMHGLWLASLWLFGWSAPINPFWLAVFALLQLGRIWVLVTLGPRWTTRILALPGETLVTSGPFRLMRHPNYAVVSGEIAVLPLCLGLPWVAAVFSLANAVLLWVRVRAETAALAEAATPSNT